MQGMELKDWVKTQEGDGHIKSQKVFCLRGELHQGYRGVAIRVDESQMTSEELLEVPDIDGSMKQVWFRRRQRLEGRFLRKSNEYDDRRAELRRKRNEIRSALKADEELGIPPSPSDISEIKRIDARMSRLEALHEKEELDYAVATESNDAMAPAVLAECDLCGAKCPEGHKHPKKWLNAHRMGKHRKELTEQLVTQEVAQAEAASP